ncbi:hypothetical protein ISR94_01310 [Candidatus Microgenomates bacterium]|nr:hypothetical protein [Candidatus Microgenomates bacterium]
MKKVFKNRQRLVWIVLVIIFTIPVTWNLLRPGYYSMQDDLQAFRIQQMDKCFRDVQIPCRWVPDAGYGYGYPQFNFYPPSVYYVGAVLHRVGFQYIDVVKILFVAGYIFSALAMFVLVESLLGSWPGFVSSVLYTYVPYKAVEVYVRGAMSEFWALPLFPVILWALYKLIKTEKKKYFIWFSVFLSLLLLTHNLMTLIFAPVAIVWAIYWAVVEKKIRLLLRIGLFGLFGVGLAAFFTLPVLFEAKFTHIDSILSGYFDYRAHFVSLYKLFISREWGYGSSGFPDELLNLSTGLIQWIVGIVAVVLGIFNYKKNKKEKKLINLILILGGLELLVLFMIHMKSSFIWAQIPALWWLQFPWRFLSVSIFLLSLLGGLAVHFSKKIKYALGGVLILSAIILNIGFFVPKDWLDITDADKFSGISWQKQMTISIFDYLPIYAEFPPITEAPLLPEIMDGSVQVVEYKKGSNFQNGIIKVSEDATIRLPLYDFPGMQVSVDGEVVDHYNDDCRGEEFCYGLITFKLPKGEHSVEAKLTNTPVRSIGNLITVASIIILVWLISKNEHLKKREK